MKNEIRVGQTQISNSNLNLNLNGLKSRALVDGGPGLGVSKTKWIWRPKQDGLDSMGLAGLGKGCLGYLGQTEIKRAYREGVDAFFD